MKLKAALLGCTLLAAAAAAQSQSYFGAEDPFAIEHTPASLNHDFRLTCEAIAKNILPATQVFYPSGFLSLCCPPLFLNQEWRLVRLAGIQGGYLPLGQLELSSGNVLRASWHSKGGRPDRK